MYRHSVNMRNMSHTAGHELNYMVSHRGSGFVKDTVAVCAKYEVTTRRDWMFNSSKKHIFISLFHFQKWFVRLTDAAKWIRVGFMFVHCPSIFSAANIDDMHIDLHCHLPQAASLCLSPSPLMPKWRDVVKDKKKHTHQKNLFTDALGWCTLKGAVQ